MYFSVNDEKYKLCCRYDPAAGALFSPKKVLPGKNNMSYLRKCDYTSGSSHQSSLEAFLGGSLRLKGSHLRCLRTKTSHSELSSGSRLSPGSGVRNCCSDPTSTRAGGQDDVS